MPTKLVLPLLVVLQDESGATVQDPIQAPPTEYGLGLTVESVETERHDYVYASGQLLREVITTTDAEGNVTTETLDFTYDASGSPYTLTRTVGTTSITYYYVVNLQGDVIRLVSANGATVAEYAYDPYGRVISATGTMAEVNPLRYRGYYYDAETEFYYLQSRYYDPVICRFVNADGYASTGLSFLGYNMYAYCNNSPPRYSDLAGYSANLVTRVDEQDGWPSTDPRSAPTWPRIPAEYMPEFYNNFDKTLKRVDNTLQKMDDAVENAGAWVEQNWKKTLDIGAAGLGAGAATVDFLTKVGIIGGTVASTGAIIVSGILLVGAFWGLGRVLTIW